MARGRMLSKSWSTSKKRAAIYQQADQLAEFCLQLFPLLVVHSDDYGRIDADPLTVKLVCDPGSPRPVDDFRMALEYLDDAGLIQRFEVQGESWLQIVKFDEHQPGLLSKRTIPKSPAAPPLTESPSDSALTQLNLTQPNSTQKDVSSEANSEPVFLEFPVIGTGTRTWTLTEAQVVNWVELFPGLNVRGEVRKALAWVQANKGRQKTDRGMPKFLVGWLSRVVDNGGSRRHDEADAARPEWVCRHTPHCLGRHACRTLVGLGR